MRFLPALFFVSLLFLLQEGGAVTSAQTPEQIRAQIADRNARMAQLEAEIAQYERDLTDLGKQKATLQNTIKALDLTRQKLTKDIALTETRIVAKDQEITALSGDISDTGAKIGRQSLGVAATLRAMNAFDHEPAAAAILGGEGLSSFFADTHDAEVLRSDLEDQIDELGALKSNLETTKTTAEIARTELAGLRKQLADQRKVLDANRAEQNKVLTQTKSKESTFQTLLAEKKALHEAFERELSELEENLRIAIDPSRLPQTGSGVLKWPLDQVTITQYFGNTPFATQNPQLYSGKGHNGIDLRASPSTRVKAARGGVVKGIGDTDLTCPGASYGKWVLLEHDNGLSTLYAHLSYISVAKGQNVGVGEVVGYSGNTGYSTGPHLHFTVYATQGVQIREFPSKAAACRGKVYIMPVADPKAYLNPLSYL